jgi:hypothetical protein
VEHALDGRRLSRNVLGELAAVWAGIWDGAAAIQQRNPDVLAVAETKTTDPEQAILELQPHLALLHPQIVASVAAFCHGVAAEFDVDPVTGVGHTDRVESERMFGGDGQQQDRAVEDRVAALEAWHVDLEDEVVRLRRIIVAMGSAAAHPDRPTNTS